MVQAFCTGEEFSIDLISDLSGRCLEAVPRSMIESKGGETIKGESLDDAALRDVAVRVAETLGIKGPACVQCFRDGDTHLVTDVNARFGGGFPVHVAAGGGYPDTVLALARGESPPPRLGSYRAGVIMVRYLAQVILERGEGDSLRVAADATGVRTPPAV
jgi:carbamoyl-phosphate synthase large subunit